MTSRERVLEALSRNTPDIPPVAILTQSATVGMMDRTGASWPEAHSDPERMARLGCAQAELFGFESVRVPFDITAEAERLGCEVRMGTREDIPSITRRAYGFDPFSDDFPDIDDLMSPSEFVSGGRPTMVAEAVRIASGNWGDTHPVCAGMLGPVSLLGQLASTETMAVSTMLEPGWTERWCSALAGIQEEYAKLLRDSGADIITVVEGVASPDVLDPSFFDRLSGSHMRGMLPSGIKSVLHICGTTDPILGMVGSSGVDAFSPDPCMDPRKVLEGVGDRVAVAGAVDPVNTLLFGDPGKVRDEARMFSEAGYHLITPGCGLAPLTPDANLGALAGAFRR